MPNSLKSDRLECFRLEFFTTDPLNIRFLKICCFKFCVFVCVCACVCANGSSSDALLWKHLTSKTTTSAFCLSLHILYNICSQTAFSHVFAQQTSFVFLLFFFSLPACLNQMFAFQIQHQHSCVLQNIFVFFYLSFFKSGVFPEISCKQTDLVWCVYQGGWWTKSRTNGALVCR